MLVKRLASPAYNKHIMIVSKTRTKLPDSNEIFPVFSTILFFVFTWTLYVIIFYLSSWLKDLTAWDILTTSAYLLYFALFESILLLCIPVLLSAALPHRFFKEQFIPQGFSLIVLASLAAYLIHPRLDELVNLELSKFGLLLLSALVVTVALTISLSIVFNQLPRLNQAVTALAERMTIFAYIYLPLGFLSLFVVVIKILF